MTETTEQHRPTAAQWQEPEHLRWSFQHMDELFPSATIGAAGPAAELARHPRDLRTLEVPLPGGVSLSVAEILAETRTDAWAVLHGDRLVTEEYFGEMGAGTRHLLMSVSKSLVSCVVGSLAGSGAIDVATGIEHCIPGLRGTGYEGATVRDLLDMRSGVRFSEEYLDPASEVRQLDRAIGWAPPIQGAPETLKDFLRSLQREREHGGSFAYRSCETDVLGWLCEEAGGKPFADLASELLWSRIGAENDAYLVQDADGTGVFDAGICATLGDLARFGAMVRDGGLSLTGQRVVDRAWADDIFAGGADSREAFAAGDHEEDMPGGMYRSQFWFPSGDRDAAFCLGIHGQMIYINRASGVVGVKLSSTALPVDPFEGPAAEAMFGAISDHLVATSPAPGD
ncbi:serine hydrolase domain-containing protein [Paeniglutamicibacter sp. NPDC091659]|uniref:serine hydrolase domain-containing protein n=1 Tax=Paeniglutamicibacter sp. NPDC091659 TaxID=3364389 RepID=UPI003803A006